MPLPVNYTNPSPSYVYFFLTIHHIYSTNPSLFFADFSQKNVLITIHEYANELICIFKINSKSNV